MHRKACINMQIELANHRPVTTLEEGGETLSQDEGVGHLFAVASIEIECHTTVADIEFVGSHSIGIRPRFQALTILVIEWRLVHIIGILLERPFAQFTVVFGTLDVYLVTALIFVREDAADGDLRETSSVAIPVVELGSMGVSAQADGVALGQESTEMAAFLGMAWSSMEHPSATLAVHREEGTVDEDKGVARMLTFSQQTLQLGIVRVIEIDHDIDIGTLPETERRLANVLSQLLRHTGWHVSLVRLVGLRTTDVVVALDGDEGEALELRLEVVHHVVQHLAMHLARPAVALDEVTRLIDETCVFVDEARGTCHKARTTLAPHLAIALELCTLNNVQAFVDGHIVGMIDRVGFGVEMRVAKHQDGILATSLRTLGP